MGELMPLGPINKCFQGGKNDRRRCQTFKILPTPVFKVETNRTKGWEDYDGFASRPVCFPSLSLVFLAPDR